MQIKMNPVGRDIITVDTESGIISGKTYASKQWIKDNFKAEWDGDRKVWIADPQVIATELENTRYYTKYLVDTDIIVDGKIAIAEKTIVRTEMIEGEHEYFKKVTYSDGTTKNFY